MSLALNILMVYACCELQQAYTIKTLTINTLSADQII